MPHKCTRCEKIFEDGAEVILSGCPNCGWNKFLYVKDMEPEEEAKEKEVQVQPEIVDSVEEDIPAEQFIREIDDIIGIGHQERETVEEEEEEGERVESVRILGPGSYELNLNSLFEREEIVMAIKQDGTYAVDLSSAFRKKKKKHN